MERFVVTHLQHGPVQLGGSVQGADGEDDGAQHDGHGLGANFTKQFLPFYKQFWNVSKPFVETKCYLKQSQHAVYSQV
jgi:hypothetical protein